NGKSWDCQVGIGGGDNRLNLGCLVAAGVVSGYGRGVHRDLAPKWEEDK
nr:hypothetical protein [Tanacetum cinerariifolium]